MKKSRRMPIIINRIKLFLVCMKIKNRNEIPFIDDTCGKIQEMHQSKNLSVSYATIAGKAKPHKHKVMEEVYYVVKGAGNIVIGGETFKIKSGDIISIPKNEIHYVENTSVEPIELVVVTHPRFDYSDVL